MLRLTFTQEDIEQLRYERFHHPHPRVQQRMEALVLKSEGLRHKDICRILDICGHTLRSYLRLFEAGGVEGLKRLGYRHPKSQLMDYEGDVEVSLLENPPATIAEAAARIEELTGIKRGLTQTAEFLKKLGLRRLKAGSLPAKADPEAQSAFKKKSWSLA